MSTLLSQLWHDGLWLALCMLGVAAVFAAVVGAAWATGAYIARTRVAMAAQHHAPPYVHREPGQAAAALGPALTVEQIADMEIDDVLPMADVWVKFHPPGSLGDYPEAMPDTPGQLGGEPRDIEDLLTGAIRHLRDMAR